MLATNNLKDKTPDFLQRLISSPQWSPDGRFVYFLWSTPGQSGGEVFAVEVPRTSAAAGIDFSRLRSGGLADETRLDFPLTALDLSASDFGVSNGAVTGLRVTADGTLLLQICQGSGVNRACGIGRWAGAQRCCCRWHAASSTAARRLTLRRRRPPPRRAGGWPLEPRPAREPAASCRSRRSASRGRRGHGASLRLQPQGRFPAGHTPPSELNLVGYGTGTETTWGQGAQPLWFVAKGRPVDAALVPTPPAVAYATPAFTATPTVTPTVAAPQPMTMLITVKRNGNAVSGARVVAMVGTTECATVITQAGATSMQFPAPSSPAACRQTGATIRFTVDGQQISVPTATYMPQANLPFDLNLPN